MAGKTKYFMNRDGCYNSRVVKKFGIGLSSQEKMEISALRNEMCGTKP